MKNRFLLLVLLLISCLLQAQNQATCFRISLLDKNQNPYFINRPEDFLSQRTIDKRIRLGIPIDERDLPITPSYKQQICNLSDDILIMSESKWQNTLVVYCPDLFLLESIKALPFVDTVVVPVATYRRTDNKFHRNEPVNLADNTPAILENTVQDGVFDYGNSWGQIAIHNGHLMHQEGFLGDSMLIAVIDGGWEGFDTIQHFRHLYENGQIWGTRDLLPFYSSVYEGGTHGTAVTSTIASAVNGELIGAAPHANFFFIRSEFVVNEQLIEEDYWAQAVEIADSIGADIITSSLGYTTFDYPTSGYTYSSCDGETGISSRNASIAVQKGMVTCVSAGNSGLNEWYYINRPSDAVEVLSVAAIAADSAVAPFSSRGPSYDGRVKPDVAAVGWNTYVVMSDGNILPGNGTSFACPIMAGMAACLWQSLPQMGAKDIIRIIRESGHQYNNPDTLMGYGIPDIYQAYLDNKNVEDVRENPALLSVSVYPNPCSNQLHIANGDFDIRNIFIYDMMGRLVYEKQRCSDAIITVPMDGFSSGIYLVKAEVQGKMKFVKICKQ